MTEINLVTLLKDWLDKKIHPLISFIKSPVSDRQGDIWIGDYDIGLIYDDRVVIGGYKLPHPLIYAADPEFFTKLDNTLKYLEGQLKNMGDG